MAVSTPTLLEEFSLRQAVNIERAFGRVHQRLYRHARRPATLDVAEREYRTKAPLLVGSIREIGSVRRDMYDHQPGLAYYFAPAERVVRLDRLVSLDEARELTRSRLEARDDEDHEDDPFTCREVVLLDPLGEALDRYDGRAWDLDKGMIPEQDWPDIEREIEDLRVEASLEAGWDNFETAQRLREQSSALAYRLAISQWHTTRARAAQG